jgi:hypothetical protein
MSSASKWAMLRMEGAYLLGVSAVVYGGLGLAPHVYSPGLEMFSINFLVRVCVCVCVRCAQWCARACVS